MQGWQGAITFNLADCAYVRDLTVTYEADEVDASSRTDAGYKRTEPGLVGLSAEFEMRAVESDPGIGALLAALVPPGSTELRTPLVCTLYDATTDKGFNGSWFVLRCSKNEPLNGSVTWSVRLASAGAITVTAS